MAKESGLSQTTFSVDDSGGVARDIRNDITNYDFATPRAAWDVTGIDKAAIERELLLADYSGTIAAIFNDAANRMHDVFKTISSTSVKRTITLVISGQTLANECVLTDYALTRAQSGELTAAVPFSLADGTVPTWA